MDTIAAEARRREELHSRAGNYRDAIDPRRSGDGVNLIGLRAEQCFADGFGLALDLTARPAGDFGISARMKVGFALVQRLPLAKPSATARSVVHDRPRSLPRSHPRHTATNSGSES